MPHLRSCSPASARRSWPEVLSALLVLCAAGWAVAQGPGRIATTAEALVTFPVFFHGKHVAVRGAVTETGQLTQLAGTTKPIFIFWRERPPRSDGEIRGEFWDLGRMEDNDPRFSAYDFRTRDGGREQWTLAGP